ncbi:MAG: TRAP transporter large permease [Rhodospirillales bacterium]|nr:TRAP transporter large permease [Rhodospirillales bacterium]
MMIGYLFFTLFFLMFIGSPIAIALGLSSITTVLFFANDDLSTLAGNLFNTMHHYTLMAIPFFVLSSAFLSTGGVARRLIRFAVNCVGHLPGGLAMASVLACIMFAAVSGSSPATVVAIGSIVIAGMVSSGYTKEFAAGVIANAGTLGILIPPSIVMVVYAAATEVSVGRMFLAGVIPGLVAGLMLMVGIYIAAKVKNLPRQPFPGMKEFRESFVDAIWGILLIFIIMGGIYGGVFTPTEAAAVAAVYAYVIGIFVYRDIGPLKKGTKRPSIPKLVVDLFIHKDIVKTLLDAAKVTIMLMFIIANAMLFAHVLTSERIPHAISEWILHMGLEPWSFLLIVNILLILAGDFMEPSAILLIMAPILFPIAVKLGIDPIHLGIIMVVNMEIGMVTPPVGLNLFVTSSITGMPLTTVLRAALPWMGILLVFLGIVTYVPLLSTWLPTIMMGPEIIQ